VVHGGGSGGGGGGDWWHLTRISSISAPLSLSLSQASLSHYDRQRSDGLGFENQKLQLTLPQLPLRFWWAWTIQLGFDFGTDDRFGLDFRQNNSQFGFGQQLWIWVWVTGSVQ
jgi:hypothetical protein